MRFNIEKLDGFQIIPTDYLKDNSLGLKEKGLLTIFYSLPNDWDYTVKGLCKITNTGITAIRNILAELENNGYLIREQTKNEKGQFEYNYRIFIKKQNVKPTKNITGCKRLKTYLNKVSRV